MTWLIDSDVLIEGERGDAGFHAWLAQAGPVALTDGVVAEYMVGVHSVSAELKARGEVYYRQVLAKLPWLRVASEDWEHAARLVGTARREQKGRPGLMDGLLAATALRMDAQVATRNLKDFTAMGCPCFNPLEHPSTE